MPKTMVAEKYKSVVVDSPLFNNVEFPRVKAEQTTKPPHNPNTSIKRVLKWSD